MSTTSTAIPFPKTPCVNGWVHNWRFKGRGTPLLTPTPVKRALTMACRTPPSSLHCQANPVARHTNQTTTMKANPPGKLKDGASCKVAGGTHAGKAGTVKDIKTSKTGHLTITVVQANGERFKTLAKNVVVE